MAELADATKVEQDGPILLGANKLLQTGSNPVLATNLKIMKTDTKDKLKVVGIMIMFISLLLYSFYVHRNEPHWFETRYVKIVK